MEGGYYGDFFIEHNGHTYSAKQLTIAWFNMSNDAFYERFGFNFNPHEYPGLYAWGRQQVFGI